MQDWIGCCPFRAKKTMCFIEQALKNFELSCVTRAEVFLGP